MAAAPYVPPIAQIVQRMNADEGFSNGVWNSIICHYFPQNTHVVMPEFRVNGGRPDLLVQTNVNPPVPIFVFEGKHGGGGDAAWDAATAQALGYIQAVGGQRVALVALGDKCRFIGNYAGDDRQLRPNQNQNPPVAWRKMGQGIVNRLDITNDAAEIHQSFVLVWGGAALPP